MKPQNITFKQMLDLLAFHGGKLVSSNDLQPNEIAQARAGNRMYVDTNSLGYVWMPEFKEFPKTVDEVAQYKAWFPLDEGLPDELKNTVWLYKKVKTK